MKYTLNKFDKNEIQKPKANALGSLKRLLPILKEEKKNLAIASFFILVTSGVSIASPLFISRAVDKYISTGNYHGLIMTGALLFAIYVAGVASQYMQIRTMGGAGRRTLFRLRNVIFGKIQELPISFFNQNKAGDLISRINNDTEQLNQFFSQALMQFIGNFFVILGIGVFLLVLNLKLGAVALIPAVGIYILTKSVSPWIKRKNLLALQSLGGLSSEVQESLENFKVIAAFNRFDYFRDKFQEINERNYKASVTSGIANNTFTPVYSLASNLALLVTLAFGIYLISIHQLTAGLLIGYLMYVNNFYSPLRHLAAIWSSFQLAFAAFDRISEILALENDMPVVPSDFKASNYLLEFKDVSFGYDENDILKNISISLEKGKTYALVGPTGGGKTTTASLMARLYDPTKGEIVLDGKDIRSYESSERAQKIGFITQEPFLFSGTVRDNIVYGNSQYEKFGNEELAEVLKGENLHKFLERFDGGLDFEVTSNGNSISLGQKQLIAFMRAVLRRPELLILDEATANIDTVTEEMLEETLAKLPEFTTKVIIAHRLNTIEKADVIYFVNDGRLQKAGSMQDAIDLLLHEKRNG